MNNEKQRIAIAEACGWKNVKLTNHEEVDIDSRSTIYWSGFTGLPPEFRHHLNRVRVPDYLTDLDAMHEAEKVLSRGAGYHQTGGFGLYKTALAEVCDEQHPIDATASQRAEAFLRTLGKWSID